MRCALEMFNEENWHARLSALAKSKPTQFVSLTFRPPYWIVCESLAPRSTRTTLINHSLKRNNIVYIYGQKK